MMAEKRRQHSLQPGDPRLIIRWTRRYAKSRTISFLVQWVFIVLMVLVVGVAAVLTNLAYSEGNLAMFSMAGLAYGRRHGFLPLVFRGALGRGTELPDYPMALWPRKVMLPGRGKQGREKPRGG